jgi:hypothetical protein
MDPFCPPVLHFCKRNKEDIFVCIRYKIQDTGSFLVTFPCIYVL